MTVHDHLRLFRERWLTVVAAMIVGALLGGAVFLLVPTRYTAFLQMYVSSPVPANSESSFLSAAQVAQDRVQSYTELATSPKVTGEVVARLGLPMTADDLAGEISASATDKSVVMSISVTASSAADAARIADAVGDAVTTTVDGLERPKTPGAIAPVAIEAVQPAPVPLEPSSPGPKRLVGIGLLVGLAAGVALALARNALDTSVKTVEDLGRAAGAPSLGTVVHSSRLAKQPLAIRDDPFGPVAEDIKRLRTNVGFVDPGNPHKMFLVTSALPGEGKTTTTLNLAAALASSGHRVLLVDADLRRPRASDLLDVDRSLGITSVLARHVSPTEALQAHGPGGFDVLASGPVPPNPSELLASLQMQTVLADLRPRYDVVLIDSSPLLPVTDAAALAPLTDGVILACRAHRTTRPQVIAAVAAVRASGSILRGTVLTMVDASAAKLAGYGSAYRGGAVPAAVTPAAVGPRPFDQETETMMAPPRPGAPSPTPRRRVYRAGARG